MRMTYLLFDAYGEPHQCDSQFDDGEQMSGKKKREKKKSGRAAADPMASSTTRLSAANVAAVDSANGTQPLALLEQLSSSSAAMRMVACRAVAHILASEADRKVGSKSACATLVNGGAGKKLTAMMVDVDIPTCVEATGALRSLAELGGEYACERLVRDDCMTPLLGILTHRNAEAANAGQKTALFSHVFATISALCEHSEVATVAFGRSTCTTHIFNLLESAVDKRAGVPHALLGHAMQLLLTVTDNNPSLAATIKSNTAALQLLLRTIEASIGRAPADGTTAIPAIVSPEVGVTAAGVLWNMDTIGVHAAMLEAIITSFVTHTAIDSYGLLRDMSRQFVEERKKLEVVKSEIELKKKQHWESKGKGSSHDDNDIDGDVDDEPTPAVAAAAAPVAAPSTELDFTKDKDPLHKVQTEFQTQVDAKVAEWQSHARAVKQSLEVLTNICTIPEEEKTDGKVEEKDMPIAWKKLIASPIMERLVAKIQLRLSLAGGDSDYAKEQVAIGEALSSVLSVAEVSSISSLLDATRVVAVQCLNNIVLNFPTPALAAGLPGLWTYVCNGCESLTAAYEAGAPDAVQETSALTGLMLTLLRTKAIPEITKPQLGFINKQARVGKTEGIRVNCVAMLGAIGQMPAHFPQNFVLGAALLEVLGAFGDNADVTFEIVCEGVNSLIDIYSDESRHADTIRTLKLTDKLIAFGKTLNTMMNKHRREIDEELGGRLEEALENVQQFAAHLRKHKL